jgi:uncharacterized membrane protein YphA (DoxX/SURF4 family)
MAGLVTKGDWRRDLIALGPSTFVGLTLFIAGVGKIMSGMAGIPAETGFADLLLKSLWTPTMAYLITDVLPVGEIILGLFLIFGIFPRIAAGLCLPLLIGFMASNSVAISRGVGEFSSCDCFGVWEVLFGMVTPMQAMVYDVVLLMLAVIILIFHPTGLLHFRPWLIKKWKWGGIK